MQSEYQFVMSEGIFSFFTSTYAYSQEISSISVLCTLGDSGDFQTSRYQDIMKATAFGVFEDLKFKISEGSDKN